MPKHVITNNVILTPREISSLNISELQGVRVEDVNVQDLRKPCLPNPRFDAMPPIFVLVRGAKNKPRDRILADGTHRALGALKNGDPVEAIIIRCFCRTLYSFDLCLETKAIIQKLQKMYHIENHECTSECAEVMAEEQADTDNLSNE